MKYLLPLLLFLTSFYACKNIKESTPENAISGSSIPPRTPPPDMEETRLLTARFWVVEHWVDMDELGRDRDQKGRWFRFNPDGTYDGGYWEDHNDHGSWFLKQGEEHVLLYTDSSVNDLKDAEWEIQGYTNTFGDLSLVKTRNYGDQIAVACKLTPLLTIPSRQQFGVD